MSLAHELWETNNDIAQACLQHPFVQGIASGTLSQAQFSYYVGQDAFYLEAFARAYSIAAAKAPDWDGFCMLHTLVDGALQERHLHESYATRWGVNLQSVEPGTTTRRYTDFLLATAWSSDTGLAATAMGPCMRLYAFLGKELASKGIPDHAYADWIRTYSNPAIDELVLSLDGLIDRYVQDSSKAHAVYRYAMTCEYDFFQAALDSIVVT